MRAHFRTLLVSSAVIGVALVACWPSAGTALPLIPLLPETTSGTVTLEGPPFHSGHATIISGDDRISIAGGPASFVGPTSASISWQFIDVLRVMVTHAGQSYQTCDTAPHYPCAYTFVFTIGMAALDPPPAPAPLADSSLTVPGTFSLLAGANVFFADSSQNFGFDIFGRSGPATITLESFDGAWFFESGDAVFYPTPEPATILLFATTGAGLGLIRRSRRRGYEHAA